MILALLVPNINEIRSITDNSMLMVPCHHSDLGGLNYCTFSSLLVRKYVVCYINVL